MLGLRMNVFHSADILAPSPRHCHHSSLPWHHKNDAERASLAAAAEEDWRERRRSNLQSHRFLRQSRWNGSGGMFRLSFSLCPSPHLRLARTERLLRNCPDLRLSLSWLLVELAVVFHAELFVGPPNVLSSLQRAILYCNPAILRSARCMHSEGSFKTNISNSQTFSTPLSSQGLFFNCLLASHHLNSSFWFF